MEQVSCDHLGRKRIMVVCQMEWYSTVTKNIGGNDIYASFFGWAKNYKRVIHTCLSVSEMEIVLSVGLEFCKSSSQGTVRTFGLMNAELKKWLEWPWMCLCETMNH